MEQGKKRNSSYAIKVYCTTDEKEAIKRQAEKAGLSASTYLCRVGQGYPISGVVDLQAVQDMAKINGDLGRLGGLLKLWLTNDEKVSAVGRTTILATLGRIQTRQEEMGNIMRKVVFEHKSFK